MDYWSFVGLLLGLAERARFPMSGAYDDRQAFTPEDWKRTAKVVLDLSANIARAKERTVMNNSKEELKRAVDKTQTEWHNALAALRAAQKEADKALHAYDMARESYMLYLSLALEQKESQ